MDREIKFRLWDKDIKRFVPEHAYLPANDSRQIAVCKREWEGAVPGEIWYDQNGVLEQFTGLRDKNGKEIYEGDILLLRGSVCRGDGGWDDAIVQVEWNTEYTAWFTRDADEHDAMNDFLGDDGDEYEVIGNIHDNPELLKETA